MQWEDLMLVLVELVELENLELTYIYQFKKILYFGIEKIYLYIRF
jgi:hypothetical protein